MTRRHQTPEAGDRIHAATSRCAGSVAESSTEVHCSTTLSHVQASSPPVPSIRGSLAIRAIASENSVRRRIDGDSLATDTVVEEPTHGTHVGSDDGHAAHRRLDHHARHPLGGAREHENVDGGIHLDDRLQVAR